jgi:hypothetical protein
MTLIACAFLRVRFGRRDILRNSGVSRPVDIQLSHAGAQCARMEAEAFGRRLRPLDPPIAGGQGAHDVRSLDLLQSLKLCRFRRRLAGRGEPAVELQSAPGREDDSALDDVL